HFVQQTPKSQPTL
nr:Chain P, CLASS 1 OUTER MEMBRANE PROTEIN VARIABLE REGION 2 [Neisseria meningitidis]1UWX_Q Chain Q, CLASS 1 OUTER MEMBRANE PROTEIN VARIABLE REGION 2 [Neisseria meningitidis]